MRNEILKRIVKNIIIKVYDEWGIVVSDELLKEILSDKKRVNKFIDIYFEKSELLWKI